MFKLLATFKQLLGRAPLRTGDAAEVQLQRIQMGIMELEDVLFHLNSCVMMPEAPEGASSGQGSQGTTDTEASRDGQQITFTGIRALAAVFRQLEIHPTQSILLAGHTDTSGGFELNYQIARQRALGVRYLLEGERDLWAAVCMQRQKVEDHQQILKFFATSARLSWDTDPGDIDDAYGDKTELALSRFIDRYNEHFAATFTAGGELAQQPHRPTRLDPALVGSVKQNAKHLWPEPLWRAVFDLYMEELADALDLGVTELAGLRTRHLRWADDRNRLVACGESFPIDSAHKDSYRSQKNRRVEILFFEDGQAPVLDCPLAMDRAHTAAECPLWHNAHFTPVYIDPFELETVPYFLKFLYFDRVHGAFRDVPKGLDLKAYGKNGGEMRTRVRYAGGVYQVQALAADVEEDTAKEFQFGFAAADQYIYTADKETSSVIKTVDQAAWDQLSEAEKLKHHDLPALWYSANYWTRDASDLKKGDTFQRVCERDGLKPYGTATMDSSKPLVFNLDDIVLLEQVGGTQAIRDADGHGAPKPLAATSRVKVLRVDPATSQLRLHRTDPATASSARIPLPRNCITELVPHAKIVLFREAFYTVARKRTVALAGWRASGQIVGARAAVRDDPDHQASWDMEFNNNEFGYTGDYQLHYFHHLHRDGEHPTSYLLYYVSMSFMLDCRAPWTGAPGDDTPAAAEPTAAALVSFNDRGVYDAMDHWNHKNYWLEERSESPNSLRIRPLWVFEEKETFAVDMSAAPTYNGANADPTGGNHNLTEDEARDLLTQDHACVRDARTAALGGQSRFLAYICRDDNHPANYGLAYAWSIRNDAWCATACTKRGVAAPQYSVMKLNKSAYLPNVRGVFNQTPVTEDGRDFGVFTLAHELGHCTGQSDEYSRSGSVHGASVPAYDQFFEPYTNDVNGTAMMFFNGAPRLHYLWFAMHYMQRRATAAPLKKFLENLRFTARHDQGARELRYTRNTTTFAVNSILHRPAFVAAHHAIAAAPQTEAYLALHYVGQDEASVGYFHAGQNSAQESDHYQAVLVVRPKIQLLFDDAGTAWDPDDMEDLTYDLDAGIKALTGEYRLTGGQGDIKNIFINFLGGFQEGASGDTNHIVRWENRANPAPGQTMVNAGQTIRVGNTVSTDAVVARLFNKAPATPWLTALGFLKTYVESVLPGETFTLEEI